MLNPLTKHVFRFDFVALLLCVMAWSCSDEPVAPVVEEPERCLNSESCDSPLVCRDSLCVDAPECTERSECEVGEDCTDEGLCAFDPDVCTRDDACDDGFICDGGDCRVGCRANRDCGEDEACTADFVCELRSCVEIGCDEGYECLRDTGLCEQLPCNGGCEAPLQCRESDDQCVSCLAPEDCDIGQSCTAEGVCSEDPCEDHEGCVEGTFCIENLCQIPMPCDDDRFEDNDDYESGNLREVDTYSDLVACAFDDDYYQLVADANSSITVALDTADDGPPLDIEIFNTVGVLFGRRQEIVGADSVSVNVGKTGVYTIRISQHAPGTANATYEMTLATGAEVEVAPNLCTEDTFEPNDAASEATEIYTGRWTGMSVCADDLDYYWIRAEGGELLRVCLTPDASRDVSLGLEVLFSTGEVLLADASADPFCVEDDLLQGDDYRARVFATADGAETPYHITFFVEEGCRLFEDDLDLRDKNDFIPREGEDPLEPVLERDLPAEFRVCPGDSDYFPIELEADDRLTATIDFVHADGNLDMRLHRPGGAVVLASTGIGDRESFTHRATESGTYYLRVYGVGDDMGAYTLDYTVEND